MIFFLLFCSLIAAHDAQVAVLNNQPYMSTAVQAEVSMAIDEIDNQASDGQELNVTFKNFRMRNTGLEKGVLKGTGNAWKLCSALAGILWGMLIGIPLLIGIPFVASVIFFSIPSSIIPASLAPMIWIYFIGGPIVSLGFGTYLIYQESIT